VVATRDAQIYPSLVIVNCYLTKREKRNGPSVSECLLESVMFKCYLEHTRPKALPTS
jgi:hypothetical protein